MKPSVALLTLIALSGLAACKPPWDRGPDYLSKAQTFYDAGDFVKARLEAQNAAQADPKNTKARYLLALIAEHDQEYKVMFGHLRAVVVAEPDNVEARLKLGTLYFLGQGWDQAAGQSAALLKLAPDDARVRLLHARVLLQQGDQPASIAELEAAVKLDPLNVEALLLQSTAYAIENPAKGLANLDAALKRLPAAKARQVRELRVALLSQARRTADVENDLKALARDFPQEDGYPLQLARFYASQGRGDEAEQLLKRRAELEPQEINRQLGYVQFLANEKKFDQAEAALQAFIGQAPEPDPLRLALARLYEGNQRAEQAGQVYDDLARRSPKSREGLAARNGVAILASRAGQLDEASTMLAAILADAPDDANALLLRAALRADAGQFDEAIADLRRVLRINDRDERALQLLAQAHARNLNIALAKDTWRKLLQVNPDSAAGLQQLAMLLIAEKDYVGAEALLRQRLARQPDDLFASGRLVEVLMAQGRTDPAEAEARRMAALRNQTGVGDLQLGRVLAGKKDLAGAAAAFRKSLATRKADPLPLEGLVNTLVAQGKSQEAIGMLTRDLDSSQNPLFAKYLLGGIYGREGDRATAEKYLEDVIRAKPDSVLAYASLASLYPQDLNARVAVYRRGLKAAPQSADLTMLLGTELQEGGRFEDAIQLYEGFLDQQPEFAPAINNLAALLLDQRTDPASHARALQLTTPLEKTEIPEMLDTVGWAHYRAADLETAVRVLERVVAKNGQDPVFRYHLGMAYIASGNKAGARQELEAALKNPAASFAGKAEAAAALRKLQAG